MIFLSSTGEEVLQLETAHHHAAPVSQRPEAELSQRPEHNTESQRPELSHKEQQAYNPADRAGGERAGCGPAVIPLVGEGDLHLHLGVETVMQVFRADALEIAEPSPPPRSQPNTP